MNTKQSIKGSIIISIHERNNIRNYNLYLFAGFDQYRQHDDEYYVLKFKIFQDKLFNRTIIYTSKKIKYTLKLYDRIIFCKNITTQQREGLIKKLIESSYMYNKNMSTKNHQLDLSISKLKPLSFLYYTINNRMKKDFKKIYDINLLYSIICK